MVLLLFGSGVAHAQAGNDPVAGRVLFDEARKLMGQGNYQQACQKFEESQKLDAVVGTQLNLADCWERIGRTASAWSTFLDAADRSKRAGQADREKLARSRAAALEPKLSRLTITTGDTGAEARIRRDDVTVGRAALGTAIPVDPGQHVVEATAPSKKKWSTTITVGGDGANVTVSVPALEDEAPASVAPAQAPGPAAMPQPEAGAVASPAPEPGKTEMQPSPGSGQRIAGFVVGGVGVVGLAVGTVFALKMGSKTSDADKYCSSGACSPADAEQHNALLGDARSARTVSIVSFATGAAAIVAGAVLVLTAPTARPSQSGLRVVPVVGATNLGVVAVTAW
jgi:serine/threonine-protein kinase